MFKNHVSQPTVSKIFHKYEEHGTVKDLTRSGRSHVISAGKSALVNVFIGLKLCCVHTYDLEVSETEKYYLYKVYLF